MKTKQSIYLACVIGMISFLCLGSSCRNLGNGSQKPTESIISTQPFIRHGNIRQPYENTQRWDWVAPIDGSGYCGPASVYHIISYYKDYGAYYHKRPSQKACEDKPVEIRNINREKPMYIDESAFGKFLQPYGTGSSWSLLKKTADLYLSPKNNAPLYHAYVCSSHTGIRESKARLERLTYIRKHLLTNDIPVVIHLESSIPFMGHYVTLIGFSPDNTMVYYVDSLKNHSGIQAVPLEKFLKTWFYVSGKFYKARWDGEWMALWHPEDGVPCDQCGD
ncbi:MAG: hypothetical protein KKD44_20445 [Proteobacteria bacterium]|nr:hypothetical protein [Pseudomonadota bacterium]